LVGFGLRSRVEPEEKVGHWVQVPVSLSKEGQKGQLESVRASRLCWTPGVDSQIDRGWVPDGAAR
jgi:hypothetical protein